MKNNTKTSNDIVKGYVITITPKDYKECCEESYQEGCKVFKDGNNKNVHITASNCLNYVDKKHHIIKLFETRFQARQDRAECYHGHDETIWSVLYNEKTGKIVKWLKRNP